MKDSALFASLFAVIFLYGCATTIPPMMKAASSGDVATIKTLQSTGVDVNVKDSSGFDALLYAVHYGHLDAIAYLADHGADLETRNPSGRTALGHAVWDRANPEAARVLLKKGADINALDSEGQTIMDLAIASDNWRVLLPLLLNHGVNLYEARPGLARLIFIGETFLLRDAWVMVGDKYRHIKEGKIAVLDAEPGQHTITVPTARWQAKVGVSITVEAGKAYFFSLATTEAHAAAVIATGVVAGATAAAGAVVVAGAVPTALASGAAAGGVTAGASMGAENAGGVKSFALVGIDEETARQKISALLKE